MYFIKADTHTANWSIIGVILDNTLYNAEVLLKGISREGLLRELGRYFPDEVEIYADIVRPGVAIVFVEREDYTRDVAHISLAKAADAIIRDHISQYWLLPMYRDWRNFSSLKDEMIFYKKGNAVGLCWDMQRSVVAQLSYGHQLSIAERICQLHTRAERLSHIVAVFTNQDRHSITIMVDGELYTIDSTSSEAMRTLACIASSFKKGRH